MDTETYLLPGDFDDTKINILYFNSETSEVIKYLDEYIELTRHIQELDQLFHVFCFNHEIMVKNYVFYNSDKFERKSILCTENTDFVCINAFIINLLSAGRQVLDSTDDLIENLFGKESDQYKEWRASVLSKEYDDNFIYRFFYELRNFSQHMHLPVSVQDGRCFFDFEQLLNTPHYDGKREIREEMQKINNKLKSNHGVMMHHAVTFSVSSYICSVTKVYLEALYRIKNILNTMKSSILNFADNNSFLIQHEDQTFNGFIFYEREQGDVHSFRIDDNPVEYLLSSIEKVEKYYRIQENEFGQITKSFDFSHDL